MDGFTNISAYKFAPLSDLKPLRERLINQCKSWGLKGTILLSPEGINLFVAGRETEIKLLVTELCQIPGLETLTPKISKSRHQPFTRMLIRIKKEIIAFGIEAINPAKRTSPKLEPAKLKAWLDEGRPLTLLDTRNNFEIKLGTFEQAVPINITKFRDFPKAVSELPPALKKQTIVMFCTGGIRCEKAGPYLESQGFENVFQLDGGILKYFEECGDKHYRGDCFVFDQRVGVDPSLAETPDAQCFVCLTPLSADDQLDSRYLEGKTCPFCFKSDREKMEIAIAKRHAKLQKVTQILPGSKPYENLRPLKVPAKFDARSLLDCLCGILKHIPREDWKSECDALRFLDRKNQPVSSEKIVRAGEIYYHRMPIESEPEVNPRILILYEDEAVIVLEKPAPLPVHPGGRYNRNTLINILDEVYSPQKLRPAHRLDANTTGLMVVSRTKQIAAIVQAEFASGGVIKTYLAQVQGHPVDNEFVCELPISDGPKELGSRTTQETGLSARTECKVIARLENGTALLEVKLVTGRTNQIRVHLWQMGWPICGEQLYLPNQKLGSTQTGSIEDPRLALHAKSLSFTHPVTKQRMAFESNAEFSLR